MMTTRKQWNQYKEWGGEAIYQKAHSSIPSVTYKDIVGLLEQARKEDEGKTSEEIANEWIRRHCIKFLQV